jgi:membrane protein required for beta-lactamase induction
VDGGLITAAVCAAGWVTIRFFAFSPFLYAVRFLALVVAVVGNQFRDPRGGWLRGLWAKYGRAAESAEEMGFSGASLWAVCVALPAVAAGFLQYLFYHLPPLLLLFQVAVLLCCLESGRFYFFARRLLAALYTNDAAQTRYLLREWGDADCADDDSPRAALAACARRYHADVLAVIFWFAAIGAAGAVLYAANRRYRLRYRVPAAASAIVEWPPAFLTVLCYALVGHFNAVLRFLPRPDPVAAATAAAEVDGRALVLERIPAFERLLMRAFTAALIAALLISAI